MHCLPQRLKTTFFEIFSSGGSPKARETGVKKKYQKTLILVFQVIEQCVWVVERFTQTGIVLPRLSVAKIIIIHIFLLHFQAISWLFIGLFSRSSFSRSHINVFWNCVTAFECIFNLFIL